MKKILAFSLAEVLVALSIIGIVGALTLPNVRKTYQQKEAHSRATKVQHVLDTATTALIRDNGSFEEVIRGSSTNANRSLAILNTYSRYMKFTNICGKTSSSTACFPTGTFSDPLKTSDGTIYESYCSKGKCTGGKKTNVNYFTPTYPNCDIAYDTLYAYSLAKRCLVTTTPGEKNSNCATAVLNDGTAIAFCSMASKKATCQNGHAENLDAFCPDVAVYFDINGPKTLNSLAITRNVFFGYLSEAGFTDYYKTISSISNGSFSE